MSDTFSERLRLIRFRRKREHTKFREELRLIPRWLLWTCALLYLLALLIAIPVNFHNIQSGSPDVFPPELRDQPLLATVSFAAVITAAAIFLSAWLFMLGYVYRDAKRRGMHPGLWTILVLILSPAYLLIGLIIYLLVREPLPFHCPQCSAVASARFNFCPNCKYNLHPVCPQCQREVSDTDKFCPYCATALSPSKSANPSAPAPPPPTADAS
jgi:hypothetical protein